MLGDPLAIRLLGGELLLDLRVVDDAPCLCIDEEQVPRLHTALRHDALRRDIEHARLRRQDHQAVAGDAVPLDGRKPLRSRMAPICLPSLKAMEAGPSQGSIRQEWNW